jgi:mono/diheme cytochrome c family protein
MRSRHAPLWWAGALLAAAALPALAEDKAPVFDRKYLSSKANIEAGRQVWEGQCRHCHGAAAYPGKAPKLNPGSLEPGFIYDRVTYGFGKMPAWKDVFSVEQRKGVVAYIKSDDFSP